MLVRSIVTMARIEGFCQFALQKVRSPDILRIGKNPQALDDLIKETASKMACCPFLVPEAVAIPDRRQARSSFCFLATSWLCSQAGKDGKEIPGIPLSGSCGSCGSFELCNLAQQQRSARHSKTITKMRNSLGKSLAGSKYVGCRYGTSCKSNAFEIIATRSPRPRRKYDVAQMSKNKDVKRLPIVFAVPKVWDSIIIKVPKATILAKAAGLRERGKSWKRRIAETLAASQLVGMRSMRIHLA